MLSLSIPKVLKANDVCVDYFILMAIIAVPTLAIMTIINLRVLAPGSLLATMLLFAGFAIVLYYVFQDLPPISKVDGFAGWYAHKLMFCVF